MKVLSIIIAIVVLFSARSGCSNKHAETPDKGTSSTAAKSETPNAQPSAPIVRFTGADTLSASGVPVELKYRGNLHQALAWDDANGHNVLICSATKPVMRKVTKGDGEDPEYRAELLAWQYVKRDTGWALLWNLNDNVDCQFDLTLKYLPGGTTITDLDSNSIAEATLIYTLACRSDVSPAEMKVIMHEGEKKYGLRGNRYIKYTSGEMPGAKVETPNEQNICCLDDINMAELDKESYGFLKLYGKYHNERDFQNAPPAFLAFAKKRWLAYVEEIIQ